MSHVMWLGIRVSHGSLWNLHPISRRRNSWSARASWSGTQDESQFFIPSSGLRRRSDIITWWIYCLIRWDQTGDQESISVASMEAVVIFPSRLQYPLHSEVPRDDNLGFGNLSRHGVTGRVLWASIHVMWFGWPPGSPIYTARIFGGEAFACAKSRTGDIESSGSNGCVDVYKIRDMYDSTAEGHQRRPGYLK